MEKQQTVPAKEYFYLPHNLINPYASTLQRQNSKKIQVRFQHGVCLFLIFNFQYSIRRSIKYLKIFEKTQRIQLGKEKHKLISG